MGDNLPVRWVSAKLDTFTGMGEVNRRDGGVVVLTFAGEVGYHLCFALSTTWEEHGHSNLFSPEKKILLSPEMTHPCLTINHNGKASIRVWMDGFQGGLIVTSLFTNKKFHTDIINLETIDDNDSF